MIVCRREERTNVKERRRGGEKKREEEKRAGEGSERHLPSRIFFFAFVVVFIGFYFHLSEALYFSI
jgi:cell division septal protein FtsQ